MVILFLLINLFLNRGRLRKIFMEQVYRKRKRDGEKKEQYSGVALLIQRLVLSNPPRGELSVSLYREPPQIFLSKMLSGKHL